MQKPEISRIKTFIEGFDEKLNGGIPQKNVVLIAGEPGTLKSTIAFYILYHNALNESIPGVYITLEQGRESILSNMEGLGLEYAKVEKKLSVVDLAMIRKHIEGIGEHTWMDIFKMYADNLKATTDYQLFVIDSLPVLEMLAELKNPRNELFHFFEWLRDLDVTALVITEMRPNSLEYCHFGEDFLADGILHVKMEQVDEVTVQRRIRCVKMRNTNHSTNFYTLMLENGVLQVTRVLSEKT
ncbi:MAG: ATPase domain-containing protein [Thermoplasmata archaeon]